MPSDASNSIGRTSHFESSVNDKCVQAPSGHSDSMVLPTRRGARRRACLGLISVSPSGKRRETLRTHGRSRDAISSIISTATRIPS